MDGDQQVFEKIPIRGTLMHKDQDFLLPLRERIRRSASTSVEATPLIRLGTEIERMMPSKPSWLFITITKLKRMPLERIQPDIMR
jgi:hypothetical protein